MSDSGREHLNYVDAAKALAIFTVILGHTVTRQSDLFTFLFAFHMPSFFFFSGYCTKQGFTGKTEFRTYASKKACGLLIPFVIFSVYGLILAFLFPAHWWIDGPLSYKIERYLYHAQPIANGAVWFLVCLLFSSLILYAAVWIAETCADSRRKTNGILCLEILFLAAAGTVLLPKLALPYHQRLPWKLDSAVTAACFQILGYLMARERIPEKIPVPIRYAGVLLLPLGVWFLAVRCNTYVNLCDITYGNPALFSGAAAAGTLWLLDLGWICRNCRLLCWLGRNTLTVFGIHTSVIWVGTEIYSALTGTHVYHLPAGICAWIIAGVTYAVCAGFVYVWNRTRLHSLIRGRMAGKSVKK